MDESLSAPAPDVDMEAVHIEEHDEQPADSHAEQPGDEEMDDLFGEDNEQNVLKPERQATTYFSFNSKSDVSHKGIRPLQMAAR